MGISKNNDYTTSNLLDYEYFSKHYKLIAINLSKQIELENPDLRQQINFVGKYENDKATMFFIIEKSEETTFECLQNSVSMISNGNTKNHKLVKGMSKVVKGTWYVIDSQTTIKFEPEAIKSSLCDYSDAFILITGSITVTADDNTDVAFKNCAPFSTCTTKINDVFADEANHISIAMPMNNLIEYNNNYADTSGSLSHLKEMKFVLVMLI